MQQPSSTDKPQPIRILLVDDNSNGLAARKAVLQELGYQITAASAAGVALREFARNTFDLIVTDFRMPEMDGIALIRKVRESNGVIPIILISGFVDALGLTEQSTGADIVIQKSSLEVAHLLRAVKTLLRRKAPRKPADRQSGTPPKSLRRGV